MIRAIIVDDEELARDGIRMRLEKCDDIEIVGEFSEGSDVSNACRRQEVDLVFLDIEMPGNDGLNVAVDLAALKRPPLVVFVTAYDEYAVKAFAANALDYLLKPVTGKRFEQTMARVRERLRSRDAVAISDELQKLIEVLRSRRSDAAAPQYLRQFSVSVRDRIKLVKVAEVDWIEAQSYYAALHAGRETYLIRETLTDLVAKLDPDKFVRIHRSAIVNRDRVKELIRHPNGDYDVVLSTGIRRRISRGYRNSIERLQS